MRGIVGRVLVVATLAMLPGVAAAQLVRPVHTAPDRLEGQATMLPRTGATNGSGRVELSAATRRSIATSVSVVGGAVVGAYLGYFLSQVVKSDWEGASGGERAVHRRQFAFSGAALGAIAGFLVRPRARAPGVSEPLPSFLYVAPTARHYIAREELQRAPVVNALEAVRTLRPEWLQSHPVGVEATGDTALAVYVVDTRVGGPEALANISIPELEELRLYEPDDAARRWGAAPHRAIEVVPASTSTP